MRKFFVLCMLIVFLCSESEAARYVEGEALVVLGLPEGAEFSLESLASGDLRDYVEASVRSADAEVVRVYEAISGIDGRIFLLVRSDTKTTKELISSLKQNPGVISASPNRQSRSK